VTSTIRKETRL